MDIRGAQSDNEWLENAIRQLREPLWRYLANQVGPDHAEDLYQLTVLAAWTQRNKIVGEPGPWLFRVAQNKVKDHLKQLQKERDRWRMSVPRPSADDGGVGYGDLYRAVIDVCREMTHAERECVQLSLFCELTDKQVAAIVGASEDAVRQRLRRVRHKLRAALGADWDRRAAARSNGDRGTR